MFAVAFLYMLRIILSISIVCMVIPPSPPNISISSLSNITDDDATRITSGHYMDELWTTTSSIINTTAVKPKGSRVSKVLPQAVSTFIINLSWSFIVYITLQIIWFRLEVVCGFLSSPFSYALWVLYCFLSIPPKRLSKNASHSGRVGALRLSKNVEGVVTSSGP